MGEFETTQGIRLYLYRAFLNTALYCLDIFLSVFSMKVNTAEKQKEIVTDMFCKF